MLNKKNSKIRVAVVGLGYWGPNLVRNFVNISNVELVYGCDLLQENLSKISKLYPFLKLTKSFNEVINDNTIDVIAIATPLSTHYLLAKQALTAGKHVLLEKPMVKTSKEARDLIRIARLKKKILMVGYTFVYSEAIKKIKDVTDKKDFGKIYYYDSTRINLGLLQKDINVIWDLACHDFSIINYLFSQKPLFIEASASKFIGKQQEVADVIISYKNNTKAHVSVSWLSPVKIRQILIGGSKKMIVYDDTSPSEKIKIYNKTVEFSKSKVTPFSPFYRSGDILIPNISQNESLQNELEHLIYCVKNNKQPITNGEMGLSILKLLEATDRSLKTNSRVKI